MKPLLRKNILIVALSSALVAGAILFASLSVPIEPNPDMRLQTLDIPLTDFQYPSLSPDGKWIAAFGGSDRSGFDLYRFEVPSGNSTRLTFDSTDVISSETAISPDGKYIAYTRFVKELQVCIVSSDGGDVRMIARSGGVGDWHPSGERLGFNRLVRRNGKRIVQLISVRPDGSDERLEYVDTVTSSFYWNFRFSPDGTKIAWIRSYGEEYCEIFIVDLATREERQLTFDRVVIDQVMWSPNDQIVFSTQKSGHNNLWMVDANGGSPTQLTRGDGPDLGAAFSRNADRMIYSIRRYSGAVWLASLESGEVEQILQEPKMFLGAALSADGGTIVFLPGRGDLKNHASIHALVRKTGEQHILATAEKRIRNLTISPDGSMIAYATRPYLHPADSNVIRVVGLDTTAIPNRVVGRGVPSLWLDNTTILSRHGLRTQVIDVRGGTSVPYSIDSVFAVPVPGSNRHMYHDNRRGHAGNWFGNPVRKDGILLSRIPPKDGTKFRTLSDRGGILFWNNDGRAWITDARTNTRMRVPGVFPGLNNNSEVNVAYDRKHFVYTNFQQITKVVLVEHPFAPPWWKSAWAYGLYGLAGLSLLVYVRWAERRRDQLRFQLEFQRLESEKFRELDLAKNHFFANISHEFRTPLTLIEGPVLQLRSGSYRGDRTEVYDTVLRNTRRLLQLVNQLLDLSRLESGALKLKTGVIELNGALRSAAASFESQAKRQDVAFVVDVPMTNRNASIDGDALEKIVTNLLSNAFKFTPRGGTVQLSVFDEDGQMSISVRDTGVGIAEEHRKLIFERFHQIDESATREYEGTGIGLALTKELVQLMGGTIEVESVVGKGSLFAVRIPLDEKSRMQYGVSSKEEAEGSRQSTVDSRQTKAVGALQSDAVSSDEEGPAETSSDNPVVLVVEDNRDMRRYIRQQLEDRYRVIEASNGKEGSEKALAKLPDLIVSDVMMPKMDGFEVCRRLKTDQKTSHIPVILLTAKAGDGHKLEGLETGADDYLVKPFDAKELRVRLRNLHEQRKRMRESYQRELVVKPTGVKVASMDEKFLRTVFETIESRKSDTRLNPDVLARATNMSRMNLHRKLKALTGYSAGELIRNFRLERAHDLLKQGKGTVSEIAHEVGIPNLSYFSKQFKTKHGVNPSEISV